MNLRTAMVEITYQGRDISNDLAPFFTSFTFEDNGDGNADNVTITIADYDGRWRKSWHPTSGDKVEAAIVLNDWYGPGTKRRLNCGTFDVDTITYSGMPDAAEIKATSLPGNSAIKTEQRTKSWEKVKLSTIAAGIAKRAGLTLQFLMDDVSYDRLDQNAETDISFLSRLVSDEACSLKITGGKLVLFDDRTLEKAKPIRTITRGETDMISYSFTLQTIYADYASCEVSYTDSKGKTIKGSYKAPGKTGPVLRAVEGVSSVAEATRKAKAKLRSASKDGTRATLTLLGDYAIVQGVTVVLSDFGVWDGTYYVETATHQVGASGYQVTLTIRKVLNF